MKKNKDRFSINDELLESFNRVLNFSAIQEFRDFIEKYPCLEQFYNEFLSSQTYEILIKKIKLKNDELYVKLFVRQSHMLFEK